MNQINNYFAILSDAIRAVVPHNEARILLHNIVDQINAVLFDQQHFEADAADYKEELKQNHEDCQRLQDRLNTSIADNACFTKWIDKNIGSFLSFHEYEGIESIYNDKMPDGRPQKIKAIKALREVVKKEIGFVPGLKICVEWIENEFEG